MGQTKVLLLVIAVLFPMKGALSQTCSMNTAEQLTALTSNGSGPLGAFNMNYMALTLSDARRFPNLVSTIMAPPPLSNLTQTWQKLQEIVRKKRAMNWSFDAPYPTTTLTGLCVTAGRECSACPATTDLGPEIVPRYINEVICESETSLCHSATGVCTNTVLPQTFLYRTGQCDAYGQEILEEFVKEIRVCCECFLF